MLRLVSVIAVALGVSGCVSGPDYVRPDAPLPESYTQAEGERFPAAEAEAEFWRTLDDPLLSALVDDALTANLDLAAASANYRQAMVLLRRARLDRLPTFNASAGVSDERLSADQAANGERDARNYDIDVAASWELDFFGRAQRNVESRVALAEATAAEHAAAQVAVVGELARSYFELRGLQSQLDVARENADNQRESLALVEARLEAGRGTEFDVARARAQLQGTEARTPVLEAEIAVAMHRIAVLTGRAPGALVDRLSPPAGTATLPERIPVGTPADLLRRRPDIAAAERRLAAATARIGIATADLFPRVTLGAMLGTHAAGTGGLFASDSDTRLIALGIDWTFLDVGRVHARIAAADAEAEADLARYRQTVLLALEETENAMVRYDRARREREHLADATAAAREASRLARLRFDGGAADFLEVLDAERALLDATDRMAQSDTRAALALVALHRSLAGGWSSGALATLQ